MDVTEIRPNRHVQTGASHDGKLVYFDLMDRGNGHTVRVILDRHSFVALADHLSMIAHRVVDGSYP